MVFLNYWYWMCTLTHPPVTINSVNPVDLNDLFFPGGLCIKLKTFYKSAYLTWKCVLYHHYVSCNWCFWEEVASPHSWDLPNAGNHIRFVSSKSLTREGTFGVERSVGGLWFLVISVAQIDITLTFMLLQLCRYY